MLDLEAVADVRGDAAAGLTPCQRRRTGSSSSPRSSRLGRHVGFGLGRLEIGEPLEKGPEGDRCLGPRQVGAEAEVRARPEGEVLRVRPSHVHRVCVREVRQVAVGRADQDSQDLTRRDLGAKKLDVSKGDPRDALDGRVVAQQLLDRTSHEAGIGAQPVPLAGVAPQPEHAAAEQVDRGLVPGEEEQHDSREQLLVRQPGPRALRRDEGVQEARLRRGPARRGQVSEWAPRPSTAAFPSEMTAGVAVSICRALPMSVDQVRNSSRSSSGTPSSSQITWTGSG